MIKNEPDHCRIAKSLNIEIQSSDLQKDYIYRDIMDIAQCEKPENPVPWGILLDRTV
ncbi:hypothetical protein C1645_833795 [Glomus cerebriforme]|uniref:Uncharacterized protein n=1 Tax=Glomus cerebriforme TaxID=658196 RepID=A0A397SD86_9GLOM|nr:hypothetical protein C1645_833795 [Glomus cerebriforme]